MAATNFTYVIKQVELALRPHFNAICADAGLSPAQYTALTVLQRRPDLTSSELARRSFVRAQTMAATIDPLLAAGLVSRTPDPQHRRRMLLRLTDAGAARLAEIAPRIDALEELVVAELDETAQADFARFLRSARRSLDTAGPRPSGRRPAAG
ncbi:MarR family winged helix-turn-helix transcriptional regulator [Microbacterium sp. SORGH_AS_0888]|uniref:MarR family winged helix-turn-helix transcriptional regulator n=1 Tax=Microbacterium sp. SORGH_AS_0888 TaxID=3041791 RepID=UPI00278156A6|nr:MarR family transcriptional regulator [Microbacterium sp. SORGH_AS_0888]MDQ1129699.1 DNA-binding MarR family transcriptional regulator [Microbacterium sp. SORGH_AS_0888]